MARPILVTSVAAASCSGARGEHGVGMLPGPYGRCGTGVQVSSAVTPSYGPQSFGHDGAGGQTGMADAKLKIGVGYTRNRLSMVDLTLPLVP